MSHHAQVNLVSEHIWCNDFLVRSFYLKNVQSQETRTLTQFHFLSWPAQGIPTSTRPLLDFRRYCMYIYSKHMPPCYKPSCSLFFLHSQLGHLDIILSVSSFVFYVGFHCMSFVIALISASHCPWSLSVSCTFFPSKCDGAQRGPWYCTAVCVIFVVCS